MGYSLKRKMTKALELPKEVLLDIPLVSITGCEEITIENSKGIIEYSEDKVRVNSASGIIKVTGKSLLLKQLTSEITIISGIIKTVEFLS